MNKFSNTLGIVFEWNYSRKGRKEGGRGREKKQQEAVGVIGKTLAETGTWARNVQPPQEILLRTQTACLPGRGGSSHLASIKSLPSNPALVLHGHEILGFLKPKRQLAWHSAPSAPISVFFGSNEFIYSLLIKVLFEREGKSLSFKMPKVKFSSLKKRMQVLEKNPLIIQCSLAIFLSGPSNQTTETAPRQPTPLPSADKSTWF